MLIESGQCVLWWRVVGSLIEGSLISTNDIVFQNRDVLLNGEGFPAKILFFKLLTFIVIAAQYWAITTRCTVMKTVILQFIRST